MADIYSMFNAVMNLFSVAEAASEIDDAQSDSKRKQKTEEVEGDTKDKTQRIVEERREQMRQRRADQMQNEEQYQHQHKR